MQLFSGRAFIKKIIDKTIGFRLPGLEPKRRPRVASPYTQNIKKNTPLAVVTVL